MQDFPASEAGNAQKSGVRIHLVMDAAGGVFCPRRHSPPMASQINFVFGDERKDLLPTRASIRARVCPASASFYLGTIIKPHHAPTMAIARATIDTSATMRMDPFW